MQEKPKRTIYQKIFSGGSWALFTVFVWELVEEGLENLIAYALSSAVAIFVTKALSTLAVITATQGIKVAIKRAIKPVIRNFTYKEGNDKMNKIKTFFIGIWANKKTILGTISSAVMVASGSGLINLSELPELNVKGFNVTPYIYYATLGIIALLGVFGKGAESVKTYFERINLIKNEKQTKSIEKQVKRELIAEKKLAEKNKVKAEKEKTKAEAKAKKEKLEAEKRAKIEEVKASLINKNTSSVINSTKINDIN